MWKSLALAAAMSITLVGTSMAHDHPDHDKADKDDVLKVWVDARAGTGEPVHWVSEGGIYAYPSGEKLFGMMGFDSSTVIWPEEAGEPVLHLTRKTYVYTDAETGEILTEYEGNPVTPIAYPYQLIAYREEGGEIFGDVTQGTGDRIRTIEATSDIQARRLGDSWAFTAGVFLDFPLPNGAQYEAWENYDFFIHPEGSVAEPHQMSWQRYGDLPPWAGGGKAIYHLLTYRAEDYAEFPPELLEWAQENKAKWLNPPADLAEIEAIQKGEAGTGWGG
jgi:hypothetical protein